MKRNFRTFFALVAIGLILLLSGGCKPGIDSKDNDETRRGKIINSCIDKGGIPIVAYWTGFVSECQFPPK